MRLDKFLQVSRLIKRRTIAKQACEKNKILVNGIPRKPGYTLKIEDIVTISIGSKDVAVRVLTLNEKATKSEALNLYEII